VIGKIERGDAARFRDVIGRNGPAVEALFLRSPGGSMYDSIEIGTLAHDLMLDTYAPYYAGNCQFDDSRWGIHNAPCTCVSGCFLIWMSGVNRYGVIVGMHRPWDTSGDMGRSSYEQAAAVYNKWLADLKAYLTKMELPDVYFSKFIATVRSGDMRMLSGQEPLELNHDPSSAEWLTNRCGQWTTSDNNEMANLNDKQYNGTPHNSVRRQQLVAKLSAIQSCKTAAQKEARVAAFKTLFGM
jgi:hypothetical protein